MAKRRHNYRFIITKYKKKYLYFDMDSFSMDGMTIDNIYDGYRVTKKNEVYVRYSYNELEDWYADIGPQFRTVKEDSYEGKLVLETSDKEQFVNTFYELTGEKPEVQEIPEMW